MANHLAAQAPSLVLKFRADSRQTGDKKKKRIYASINAVVFMLNRIERRYVELERMFIEYDVVKVRSQGALAHRKCVIDIGYEHGNHMVSLAWDLVDWCDKLRRVLGSPAGLEKKLDWYKRLVKILRNTEDMRHFLQHYNAELERFVVGSFPLMGTVYACFQSSDGLYTRVIPSTPIASAYHEDVRICGFEIPDHLASPFGNLCFSIATMALNLSEVVAKLRAVADDMKSHLRDRYGFDWPPN